MQIINISGKAQHGKDTTSLILKEKLESKNKKVLIAHYADLLKYEAKQFFNWNGLKDEQGRHILQYIGTDVIRAKNPNYWVDFVKEFLTMFQNEWDYVIIPDCRFPNECEAWKIDGWSNVTVRVVRGNFISNLTTEQLNHPSETALDDYKFDYYIHNDSGIDELKLEIDKFINYLGG
ncbi:MAG: hypothetical protein LLF98_01905 [Clostridium sp.]|uniref:deoxynucleotide monophosphate kinase family protein n=1 Tax=Clostridium sp. TaxID=1506 RepID=UPI0025BFA8C9|nr:hypothetical protein [Clostridium sp.]MCE5220035.1 hypothetical protein [Clostridium sp.]